MVQNEEVEIPKDPGAMNSIAYGLLSQIKGYLQLLVARVGAYVVEGIGGSRKVWEQVTRTRNKQEIWQERRSTSRRTALLQIRVSLYHVTLGGCEVEAV